MAATPHLNLVASAKRAIDKVASDTDVDIEHVIVSLDELKTQIQEKIDALEETK